MFPPRAEPPALGFCLSVVDRFGFLIVIARSPAFGGTTRQSYSD